MPEARVTLYLRLKPDLAAEIEADRVALALPTTTAAAELRAQFVMAHLTEDARAKT